ncbi:unnamed protein product [Cunninghamella echinulata]
MNNTATSLNEEALSILDVEASRRINEIRQNIHFICSSLRAQGNMTVNQLLKAVQSLTMKEFFSSTQEGTETHLPPISNKQTTARSDSLEVENKSKNERKRLKPTTNGKGPTSPIIKEKNPSSSSSSSASRIPNKAKATTKSTSININNQNKGGLDMKRKKQHDDENEEEEEEDNNFGPFIMQFTRPNHPSIIFELDPKEELDESTSFELEISKEYIDQLNMGHRRRVIDQIQHLQDHLEILKNRIKSSSSPSPSL